MSFLLIDGLVIPVVSASPRQSYEDIGRLQRAANGRGLSGVRGVKRSWDVLTPPMSDGDAEALIGLLTGGVYYDFDSVPYSTAGYIPISSDVKYAAAGKAGSGALQMQYDDLLQLVDATHTPFSVGYDLAWSISTWLYGTSATAGHVYYAGASKLLIASTAAITWKAAGLTLTAGSGLRGSGSALWDHVVCVLYRSGADAKTYAELWLNGSMVDSDATVADYAFPALGDEASLYIGTNAAGAEMFGAGNGTSKISQLVFAPCRLTSRWISALANSNAGVTLGSWPIHAVSGDVIGGRSSVSCHVRVVSTEPRQCTLSGAWANNARSLSLSLVEV